jgi:heat shock protein HtpX
LLVIALLAALTGQLAIGRAGEYAADQCGARLSGRPDALITALRLASTDDADFEAVANSKVATAMLAIGKWLVGPRRDNPLSAYPLRTNRIAALEQLSRKMGWGEDGGRG